MANLNINNIKDIKDLIDKLENNCLDELNWHYIDLAKQCANKYPDDNSNVLQAYIGGWKKLTNCYLKSVKKQLKYLEVEQD